MSSIHSSSASSSVSHGVQQPTTLVAGQSAGETVSVQSQLATANIAEGTITHKSNIPQVVSDLSALHGASSGWLDSESQKVSQWGQGEIARILGNAKLMEEQLVAGAREKQKALDAKHSGELAKLVQQMDLRKAAELKELEDGLQRQIQAALTQSKADINGIESQMNVRKMELLKQSQLRSAKEIDALSNLVVETKLVPSQTKTIIETNTSTAPVIAVATGGSISTGSAAAESYSSARIAAVPVAGQVNQAAEVTRGDMVQDATGRKVGEGAIVNTMTSVSQQPTHAAHKQHDVTVQARPAHEQHAPIAHTQHAPIAHTQHVAVAPHGNGLLPSQQHIASDLPQHAGRAEVGVGAPVVERPDAKSAHGVDTYTKREADEASTHATAAHDGVAHEKHHHKGLMGKVKHALGMEPKSTDAAHRV